MPKICVFEHRQFNILLKYSYLKIHRDGMRQIYNFYKVHCCFLYILFMFDMIGKICASSFLCARLSQQLSMSYSDYNVQSTPRKVVDLGLGGNLVILLLYNHWFQTSHVGTWMKAVFIRNLDYVINELIQGSTDISVFGL